MDFINCKLGFHSAVNSGEIEYFDAFVSYHPQDLPFVDELTQKLEDEEGFKLCITDRDMCVGITQHAATAELIEKRCVSKGHASNNCGFENLIQELVH